ncbi:MAG: GNAT family N-acetyltransferase, partial [Flavobacteriales bacterium]|nr:GNAT family N-acetyltransferase [Flavobacteriales bacterium]
NRTHLIDKYFSTGVGYFNIENELVGFYLPDFGRGLVLSKDKKAGIELLKLKHSKKGQRTLVPIDNEDGVKFFENNGFKKADKSSKMILGKENKWIPSYIYSYGSGYCG